jgi:hypothetical protein
MEAMLCKKEAMLMLLAGPKWEIFRFNLSFGLFSKLKSPACASASACARSFLITSFFEISERIEKGRAQAEAEAQARNFISKAQVNNFFQREWCNHPSGI